MGLPTGSVRSLLALIPMLSLVLIATALVVRLVLSDDNAAVKDLTLLVVGAIIGVVGTATAWYFKDRDSRGSG